MEAKRLVHKGHALRSEGDDALASARAGAGSFLPLTGGPDWSEKQAADAPLGAGNFEDFQDAQRQQ